MIVIHTLEEVLNEEFSHAGSAGKAFDKAYRIIDFFKRKKSAQSEQTEPQSV